MHQNILLRVTAPAVLVGVLMLGTCLGGTYAINRLQTNLAGILSANVASSQAVQDLEIKLRQLRFHSFVAVIDPSSERAELVAEDHRGLDQAIQRVGALVSSPAEKELFRAIQEGYTKYRAELIRPDSRPDAQRPRDLIRWADSHPVRHLLVPCQELLDLSRKEMQRTAQESEEVSRQARAAMLLLGVAGPLGGLLGGYGIARGLSRSMARLNVWVRDVHAQIDQQAGSISLDSKGDPKDLDQQLQRVVSRVRELVEQLQKQQQDILRAEQLAAVGQLASSVAHEVRNPLTSIKLLIEVALRHTSPKRQRGDDPVAGAPGLCETSPKRQRGDDPVAGAPGLCEGAALTPRDLEVIHGEIKHMEKTVQGLLDFARLPRADRRPCDVREILSQTVDLVRPRADQQGVAIAVQQPADPLRAAVDRGQLETVLLNLCLNALDAMPHGGRLDLDLSECGMRNAECGMKEGIPHSAFRIPHSEVRLEVKDTGPGIAPSIAPRLFTPFTTTKPTGTGLGLSICRRVMDEHGGTIQVKNRPEGGAVFTLTLPAVFQKDEG